jgi:hypothetical protein
MLLQLTKQEKVNQVTPVNRSLLKTLSQNQDQIRIGEVTKSSIELFWSVPLNNGCAPIVSYVIEKRSSKQIHWTPCDYDEHSTKCHFVVNQYRECYEYEFRLAAKNKAGVGDFTAPTQPFVAKDKILGNKPLILEPLKTTTVPLRSY